MSKPKQNQQVSAEPEVFSVDVRKITKFEFRCTTRDDGLTSVREAFESGRLFFGRNISNINVSRPFEGDLELIDVVVGFSD